MMHPRLASLIFLSSILGSSVQSVHRNVKSDVVHLPQPKNIAEKSGQTVVQLDVKTPISEVDPEFLSVTIDANDISSNWSAINFTAQRIVNMAKGLVPTMLRVGGTSGDYLIFNSTTESIIVESNFTMTPLQWDEVNEFVETVGWSFVFGLNGLLRTPYPNGTWNPDNARSLLSYTTSKNYTVQWELGNEPDLWKTPIPASDHAKDYTILKEVVMDENTPGKMLIGPDVAYKMDYFTEFIDNVPSGILNATTYHHYYGNGNTATLSQCYDVNILDSFIHQAVYFQASTSENQQNVSTWLGETSSFYDGGAPNLSDRYAAGFMWLDKLGIAAVVGHKRVFRQTFVGGNYALLDFNQNPLPDYWLSLLYKKLVGTRVLYVAGSLKYGRIVRTYAHCAKSPYPSGSVVLLLLNTNASTSVVSLLNEEMKTSERDVYWLTPLSGNLTSTTVLLNGVPLQLEADKYLPQLSPVSRPPDSSLSLPGLSFGFVVFKNATIPACT